MAERLRQEETLQVSAVTHSKFLALVLHILMQLLQALEAAVGGQWEGGQEFDLSDSEGSLLGTPTKGKNKSGTTGRPSKSLKNLAFFMLWESDLKYHLN